MSTALDTGDLARLVKTVFRPGPEDRSIAVLADLPDEACRDNPAWSARRELAVDWHWRLSEAREELGLDTVSLVFYRNVRRNNADLPGEAWVISGSVPPNHADAVGEPAARFSELFSRHRLLVALTEFSATAPLKLQAPQYGFRAATMPGFTTGMLPALKLDYDEIHGRCVELKKRLDRAVAAHVRFETPDGAHELVLDLRHRKATASGGLVRGPGTAGNLPSGETYIVPYEGERPDDPSRTAGVLPVELDGELLWYRIAGNKVVEVIGEGPVAGRERGEMHAEPGYANVAELGLGLLSDYGIRPVGEILLDEKLRLHIAFGRSDHFGGQVGAADFSSPDKVVHIDRVYLPEVQPSVRVPAVDLEVPGDRGSEREPLMRDGGYV